MKRFKIFTYLTALVAVVLCAGSHTAFETVVSFIALASGLGINPGFSLGACAELNAFRTATEYLDQRIQRSPRLGRSMFFRNLVPKAEFVQNTGVTHSTFTIKASEPTDDNTQFQSVTLAAGMPTPACDTTYEDIGVGYFERTYGPKKRRFRGPIICKETLQFLHNPGEFISGYIDEMGLYVARAFEFAFRSDLMAFGDWFSDGTKYVGPNGSTSVTTVPSQGLSQGMLDDVAVDLQNTGAGVPDGRGYVEDGNAGPIFPLYIDAVDSRNIVTQNSTVRDDFRYASMGLDGAGDQSLWKAIGSTRVIGNFRHIPTFIAPRFNFTGGALVPVSPFKDIATVGTDQEILTNAYKNAAFGAALVALPSTMTAEVVRPATGGLNWDAANYNGEFNFITGGERICSPAEYDPEHHKGRHFASIFYAPKPGRIHDTKIILYKRCKQTSNSIFCS